MSVPEPVRQSLLLLVAAELALVLPAIAIAWWFGLSLSEQFPTGWALAPAVLRGVVASAPPLAALAMLVRSRFPPLARFRQRVEQMLRELLGPIGIGGMLAVSAAAGIGEELLFRGTLQPLLVSWLTPAGGILVASLLFGLAHPFSRLYVAWAGVIGLYLGVIALLSGGLISAIVAHGVYDFVAIRWLLERSAAGRPQ